MSIQRSPVRVLGAAGRPQGRRGRLRGPGLEDVPFADGHPKVNGPTARGELERKPRSLNSSVSWRGVRESGAKMPVPMR